MKCFKNLLLKNLVSGALIILAGQSVFAENSENKSPLKGVFESIKVEAVRSKSTYDSQSGDLSVDHNLIDIRVGEKNVKEIIRDFPIEPVGGIDAWSLNIEISFLPILSKNTTVETAEENIEGKAKIGRQQLQQSIAFEKKKFSGQIDTLTDQAFNQFLSQQPKLQQALVAGSPQAKQKAKLARSKIKAGIQKAFDSRISQVEKENLRKKIQLPEAAAKKRVHDRTPDLVLKTLVQEVLISHAISDEDTLKYFQVGKTRVSGPLDEDVTGRTMIESARAMADLPTRLNAITNTAVIRVGVVQHLETEKPLSARFEVSLAQNRHLFLTANQHIGDTFALPDDIYDRYDQFGKIDTAHFRIALRNEKVEAGVIAAVGRQKWAGASVQWEFSEDHYLILNVHKGLSDNDIEDTINEGRLAANFAASAYVLKEKGDWAAYMGLVYGGDRLELASADKGYFDSNEVVLGLSKVYSDPKGLLSIFDSLRFSVEAYSENRDYGHFSERDNGARVSFATNTPHRLKRQSKKASLLEKKEELLAKISRSHAKEKNGTESRTRKAFKWLRSNKKQRSRWADEIRKIDRELEKIK